MPIRSFGDDDHTGDGITKPSNYKRPFKRATDYTPRWIPYQARFGNKSYSIPLPVAEGKGHRKHRRQGD